MRSNCNENREIAKEKQDGANFSSHARRCNRTYTYGTYILYTYIYIKAKQVKSIRKELYEQKRKMTEFMPLPLCWS